MVLESNSKVVDDYFKKKGAILPKEVDRLLEIGIMVVERVETSNDVDFVKKEIDSMIGKVDTNLERFNSTIGTAFATMLESNFSPDKDSSYMRKTVDYMRSNLLTFSDAINGELKRVKEVSDLMISNAGKVSTDKLAVIEQGIKTAEEKFNPSLETSYLGALKKTVIEVQEKLNRNLDFSDKNSFATKLDDILAERFGESSPLFLTVRSEMDNQIKSLTDEINKNFIELREIIAEKKGQTDTMKLTAVKGFDFEDELFEQLQNIAKSNGDIVTMVGDKKETASSKKGDFIYEFASGDRLVIEAKDTAIGLKPMIAYLNEAMENRDCSISLLITKDESQLQKQIGSFNFYEGNKLFTHASFIEQSLRWIRLYLSSRKANKEEGAIDENEIVDALAKIRNHLKNYQNIKTKLTGIKKVVDENTSAIETILSDVKDNISNDLTIIEAQFN